MYARENDDNYGRPLRECRIMQPDWLFIFSQIIMVNMLLCITILCNNVLFYHYMVSQVDGSMLCDKPVNVL